MSDATERPNAERSRLEAQREGRENWRLWGPYLAERAWGTVREDYSADGTAWEHFGHDQAVSRVFRWNEDGIAGICDEEQRLIFALALWNGRDPILKERLFGLTGKQGNHGEDVKECYFHLDATPSHSWLRYLYKYPQGAYPYDWLLRESARRSRADPPVTMHEAGAFRDDRYWDVEMRYAKVAPEHILIRLYAANRGPEPATSGCCPACGFATPGPGGRAMNGPPCARYPRPRGRCGRCRRSMPAWAPTTSTAGAR